MYQGHLGNRYDRSIDPYQVGKPLRERTPAEQDALDQLNTHAIKMRALIEGCNGHADGRSLAMALTKLDETMALAKRAIDA